MIYDQSSHLQLPHPKAYIIKIQTPSNQHVFMMAAESRCLCDYYLRFFQRASNKQSQGQKLDSQIEGMIHLTTAETCLIVNNWQKKVIKSSMTHLTTPLLVPTVVINWGLPVVYRIKLMVLLNFLNLSHSIHNFITIWLL